MIYILKPKLVKTRRKMEPNPAKIFLILKLNIKREIAVVMNGKLYVHLELCLPVI